MGSAWADSGTGRKWDGNSSSCGGTGNAETEISNGRGRETSVGKGNIATVPVPVPSRPLPRGALVFYTWYLVYNLPPSLIRKRSTVSTVGLYCLLIILRTEDGGVFV